jgi:putative ATP-grasp target RiPP
MFNYTDRFPTGPALPNGIVTPRPWALGRLRPYPDVPVEYGRVELDPATQIARYLDAAGQPVMMPKHGTSTGTSPVTGTGNPSDGRGGGDTDRGNDSDQ